jgi:cytochrome b subunit of formate dehydrogenase
MFEFIKSPCIPLFQRGTLCGLILIRVLVATAHADEVSTETCLSCHGTEGFADPNGRSLFTGGQAFNSSAHAALGCTTCHSDISEIPHAEKLKPVTLDTCATCHEDIVTAYRTGVHGQANSHGVREAATCQDCHGNLHAAKPHEDPESATHWRKLAATCARCHANLELAEKFKIPVVRPVEAYLASTHARVVQSGKRAAECADCHGAHDILPASDPRSSITRANVPATCGKCHTEILNTYRESVHGEALAHGNRDAPVCTDCHGEHRILEPGEPTSPVFAANIPGETCGRCHGDKRLSEKYGLTLGRVAAFQDSFHGLALRAGQLTVANCSSCHGVHDIRPSSDPRSHVYPANLAATCGKCHPGAGTGFALGPVHATGASTGAWAVGWVRFVYLWLIGGTIGFMLVHNLLDLSRKARRLSAPPRAPLPNRPERMTRWLRWQHGLVMISFPVLVYTGFALTYPETWWAKPLLGWEAQFALRGTIHRAAAVILVIAVAWHFVHLLVSPRLRACLRLIVPSWRDAVTFFQMLAYYLGRRATPPHGATFNYAEKAEYWAFMWGTAVMTMTGFLLWFENTTLTYLPGWAPAVATAIHFYEAILATLSILVWHFYWVIFDPDVYPIDWTWWDGHPPASRTLERSADADPASEPDAALLESKSPKD